MPQVINTNLASLNAQRNLDKTSGGLNISLQRLSSGLRINSAKDDAAGLAIATRFTSQISGLTQASRNANDAISLAQVSEGALQEVTTILQRARELAIQSANGSNSAADRKALQAEVNQLKQELTRIATTTTFNGNNVLDGNLSNTQFQIGTEANQTVAVSIKDTRTTAIGTNELTTNNTGGIEQATYRNFIGGGFASDASGLGAEIGVGSDDSTNGYVAETFTITNVTSTGATTTQSGGVTANDGANTIATTLSGLTGVSAQGFNHVTFDNYVAGTAADVSLTVAGSEMVLFNTDASTFAEVATVINADAAGYAASGIYAISSTTDLQIIAMQGHDVQLTTGGANTADVDVTSAFNGGNVSTVTGTGLSHSRGGRVDVTLDQGYSVATSTAGVLGDNVSGYIPVTAVGNTDVTGNNSVTAQGLTLSGSSGSGTVSISLNDEASAVVTKVNAISGSTNITAKAQTTVTLQNLSNDGTISFQLYGDNTAGAAISAAITTNDFTALAKAINDIAGNTGITAATDGANNIITLTHSTGKDIQIKDFEHSAAVDYQDPTSVPVTGDGSTVQSPVLQYLDVIGNNSSNSGTTVKLSDGGTSGISNQDSTVIGGQVSFNSSETFSVSSDINGVNFSGSLFSGVPTSGNTSTANTVNGVDISTIAGANSAIAVLDDAINQISEIRADLGAYQSRFESAIRNIANNVENLNVARSRILDTDFAAETAALAKNQILAQAGIAVLAQANSLPQNVLKLLQ